MKKEFSTHNEQETIALGIAIGSTLRGGEIILLKSDVGGGKTTFTRGLAEGLGSSEEVSSPTFVIAHVYIGRHELHHYDLYRLGDMGLMNEELQETISDGSAVVVIEWPDIVEATFPPERLVDVTLRRTKSAETDRDMTFTFPETLSYMFSSLRGGTTP